MSEKRSYIEETRDILKGMKDVRAPKEINKELDNFDVSDAKAQIIEEMNAKNEEYMKKFENNQNLVTENRELSLLEKKLALFTNYEEQNKEKVEALKEEKKESEEKFKKVQDYLKDLSKEKAELEHYKEKQIERFKEQNEKIKELFKEINSGELSDEEIAEKKKEARGRQRDRITKEELLEINNKLEDIEASIALIGKFSEDPRKYFEDLERDERTEEQEEQQQTQPQTVVPVQNRTVQPQQGPQNFQTAQQGQWVWQPATQVQQQAQPQQEPENAQPVQEENTQTEPVSQEVTEPVPEEPVQQEPNNLENELKELTQITYNDKLGKYIYTFSNGEQNEFSKAKFSEQFKMALQMFKTLRTREPKRKFFDALRIASKMDYNILKVLKDMGYSKGFDSVRPYIERYVDYIKNENEMVKYNFTGFKLKDLGVRYFAGQRDKLVKLFDKIKGRKTQETEIKEDNSTKQDKEKEPEITQKDIDMYNEINSSYQEPMYDKPVWEQKADEEAANKAYEDLNKNITILPSSGEYPPRKEFVNSLKPDNGEYAEPTEVDIKLEPEKYVVKVKKVNTDLIKGSLKNNKSRQRNNSIRGRRSRISRSNRRTSRKGFSR